MINVGVVVSRGVFQFEDLIAQFCVDGALLHLRLDFVLIGWCFDGVVICVRVLLCTFSAPKSTTHSHYVIAYIAGRDIECDDMPITHEKPTPTPAALDRLDWSMMLLLVTSFALPQVFMKYSSYSSPADCRSAVRSAPAATRKYRPPIRFAWRTSPGMWPSTIRPICGPPRPKRRAPDADRSCCRRARLARCVQVASLDAARERLLRYRSDLLGFAHHIHELLVDDLHEFERLLTGDRVDEHVAMEVHTVLGREYAVLILAGRIDQLHFVVGGVDACNLRERFARRRDDESINIRLTNKGRVYHIFLLFSIVGS